MQVSPTTGRCTLTCQPQSPIQPQHPRRQRQDDKHGLRASRRGTENRAKRAAAGLHRLDPVIEVERLRVDQFWIKFACSVLDEHESLRRIAAHQLVDQFLDHSAAFVIRRQGNAQ